MKCLSRRAFVGSLAALGGSVAGLVVLGGCERVGIQSAQLARPRRIGFLSGNLSRSVTRNIDILTESLREQGYVVGTDIVVEPQIAEAKTDQLPRMAADLSRLPVDVLVAEATPAALAAKQATTTVPIVFVLVNDPVGQGLVASLARPGGNITGVSTLSGAISGKRMEILKEVVPGIGRVAVLWNAANPGMALALGETEEAARALGIRVDSLPVHSSDDLEATLEPATADLPDALLMLPNFGFGAARVADFGLRQRLPTMSSDTATIDQGVLMALGPPYPSLIRRAGDQVVKILRGAKPADLPVEQPTTFEFVVNVRTVQALGLTIPPDVAAQVTEWVQ